MQGKKTYQEKLFTSFQLSDRVPAGNFYRRLKETLDLQFLYERTRTYYGDCGQQSIDPQVFFKFCLVGYLENITSDRSLASHCSLRMDILYFLGYNIDDELPWHSTISRTRQLFPDTVFEELFSRVLRMCVEKGMVAGHTQAVDSALVKANASMDSLELKVPAEALDEHIRKVRVMSSRDRKAKEDKSTLAQRSVPADSRELKEIESRNRKWSRDQDQRPGATNKNAKYTSNKTHYSPTDPDARIAVKPGKARKLCYLSQMAVDTAHHVITHMGADYADKKDNQCLQELTRRTRSRLRANGLIWENLLADTGYSSGENYAFLEREGIQSYIPPHGTYKGGPEGFTYVEEGDYWLCRNGKKVTFRKVKTERKNNIKKKQYLTRRSDCKGCAYKSECIGKGHERRIDVTYYREEYERAIERVDSYRGRRLKKKRQSTVEPVFGTLLNFLGMQKIRTLTIGQANKCMLMAAAAYNIKKYLKFAGKKAMSAVKTREKEPAIYFDLIRLFFGPCNILKFS